MTDAPLLVQSGRALAIMCGGCSREVHARFETTPKGFRQVAYYCPCGFLNVDPRIVDDADPSDGAVGETAGVAA